MAEVKFEAIVILVILLPGLLAARLQQRLTVNRDASDLDKVVEALIYSFFTYLIFTAFFGVVPVSLIAVPEGNGTTGYYLQSDVGRLIFLPIIALALAIGMSFAANHDVFGRCFRFAKISRRSWRDSIWSDVFHNFGGAVQVELSDGRSVMGWLKYFADRPAESSLFLEHAAWVNDEAVNKFRMMVPEYSLQRKVESVQSLF